MNNYARAGREVEVRIAIDDVCRAGDHIVIMIIVVHDGGVSPAR